MTLTERLAQAPHPSKWLCRLHLCSARKMLYHGEAVFENAQKRNHTEERVWGIYHFSECPKCGRVEVDTLAWETLNEKAS